MVDATDALARDEVPVDNLVGDEGHDPEVLQDLLEPVEDENDSYRRDARFRSERARRPGGDRPQSRFQSDGIRQRNALRPLFDAR